MKNKNTAALFALLLGWVGVHRFYLGNPVIGIIYIVFFMTGIPFIISLVEFVYFLIISKEEFDVKYNADYIMKKDYISKIK